MGGETEALGLVDASAEVVRTVTGDVGQRAQEMGRGLAAALEGLEHSTAGRMARISGSLAQLRDELEAARGALGDSGAALGGCLGGARAAHGELRAAAAAAQDALAETARQQQAADTLRAARVREMLRRNDEFELRLQADHAEFVRMHARRLARALQ
ncbi:hypothetical protein H4R18_003913 [Coemansia javaensis]|uniref:Uncharacterized protein n=1 Tax=Coemansia javaensis TaxID=2761396 RepID=A0A9W8HDU1_9FUNG|nr:hypothetical protein H4R18_003913 [Coemansia javaensis]